MSGAYFLYVWFYPDGTPFYVGIGTLARVQKRLRNRIFNRVVEKLNLADEAPYQIVYPMPSKAAACEAERDLIAQIGRRDIGTGPLVNLTAGGDGVESPSPATRELIGAANRGKTRSPETCARIGAAKRGAPFPEASKAKVAAANRGQRRTPEQIENMRRAKAGYRISDITRAAQRAAMLGRKQPRDLVARRIAAAWVARKRNITIRKLLTIALEI